MAAEPRELEAIRPDLDDDNAALLEILAHRQGLTEEVTARKLITGEPAHQPERFAAMEAAAIARGEELGLRPEFVKAIFKAIHEDSLERQREAGLE